MKKLPEAVSTTVENLRKERKRYVEVKVINGRYCLFESTSKWDRQARKPKKITQYLGSIKDDGQFVPTKKRAKIEKEERPEPTATLSKIEAAVLTNLSMNARMSMPLLAKRINRTKRATEGIVRRLEKKLNIKYIAEINTKGLDYSAYIVFVKLKRGSPSAEELRAAFENEPLVQFAAMTTGQYDFMIYFLAKDNDEASVFVYQNMILSKQFAKYVAKWYVTPFGKAYNFIPLREKFFDALKWKVWKKTKERPRKQPDEISEREFAMLKELNANGLKKFAAIDEENGFDRGASQYLYYKLKNKDKLLKRITLSVQSPPLKYLAVIIIEIVNGAEYVKARKNLMLSIIAESKHITDRFALEGEMGMPYGVLLIAPITDENGLDEIKRQLLSRVKGIRLSELIITNTVVGQLCYRRFDNTYSGQYNLLVNFEKVLPKKELVNYEETGRARKPKVSIGFRGERKIIEEEPLDYSE